MKVDNLMGNIAFVDGSLRDIYIFDVGLGDWNRLLKLLKDTYPLECDEAIPDNVQKIIPIREERGFLLKIKIGDNIAAHCHFYVSIEETSPIEFDLDPRELQSPYAVSRLTEFMKRLGEGLNKEVFLTEENSEDAVLLSYSPTTKLFSIPTLRADV